MRKIIVVLGLLAAAMVMTACGDKADLEEPGAGEAPPTAGQALPDSSRTSVDRDGSYRGEDLAIWKEFVAAMRSGGPAAEKLRPYYEDLREPILGFLKEMRGKATWPEWDKTPKVFRVQEHVHFLIPLTFDGRTAEYCFTFLDEGGKWFFRHLEAIMIRLDLTGPLPTSTFPDVDEGTKAHIREETSWSREIRLFNLFAELKGKDFAFDVFKDGNGYFLAAKTWVPFVEPRKAFILYACWEQANLRGNAVTLEKLDDDEALVRISTAYFGLYKASAHLAQQVSFEDYVRIFETIWKDRARAAGWSLEIEYRNEGFPASECVLRFKRAA
jgi:predicted small lipoprotein YifL